MKKQKLVLTGLVGFAFLFGCSQVDEGKVEASLPNGYVMVSENEFDKGNIYTLKHIQTGCHYTYTTSIYRNAFAPNVEQMFIEKDGVSVPYCDKVGE